MLPTITAKRIAALAFIGRHEEDSISLKALADKLGRKPHLVKKTVRDLELSGLVDISYNPLDVLRVGTTKKGREVYNAMTPWAAPKDQSVRGMGAILRGEA